MVSTGSIVSQITSPLQTLNPEKVSVWQTIQVVTFFFRIRALAISCAERPDAAAADSLNVRACILNCHQGVRSHVGKIAMYSDQGSLLYHCPDR